MRSILTKNVRNMLLLLAASFVFGSCGKDGNPGNVYLAIVQPTQYCYYFTSYTDDDSGIPYGLYYDEYYLCSPGTYSFDYYVSSTCGYSDYHVTGTYTLIANGGSKGGLFSSGSDGADKHYDLNCEWNGAAETYYRSLQQAPMAPVYFDKTYTTHGNQIRVKGKIVYGEKPPINNVAKNTKK